MTARKSLISVLIFVFFLSLGFSLYYKIRPTVDAKAYDKIAWNLVRGYGYIENENLRFNPLEDDAIVRVGPGYEFFLASIYKMFGRNREVVWILQAILRVLTALIIYNLTKYLFKENEYRDKVSLLAALIFGITPDLIIVGGMLLAETLFITLLTGASYYSLKAINHPSTNILVISGLLWGLASLVRPTALLGFLFFAIIIISKKQFAYAAIIFVFPLLLVGSWSVRNSILYDRPLFTTTAGAYALWVGNNSGATGGYDKTPEIQNTANTYHSVELSKISIHKYFSFLIENPLKFTELQIRKAGMYFSFIRPTGFWFYLYERPIDQVFTLALSAISTALLFVLGSIGAFKFFLSEKAKSSFFVLGIMAIQPLSVIPTYVETRYRYPLYPFLAIFAAFAVIYFYKRFWVSREKFKGSEYYSIVLKSLLFFLFFTVVDFIYSRDILFERIGHLIKNLQ